MKRGIMELKVKTFSELTTGELYEILKARAEIFVVEQNCVYQDLDDRDQSSLHIFFEEKGRVKAYLRAFALDDQTVQIGRVLTLHHGTGLGGRLLKEGIRQVWERYAADRIYIEAQCYATGFYEKVGFRICTGEFMEDGIPHVGMDLKKA